jgi:hypothetical protein
MNLRQGLVANGVKVYVVALPTDSIVESVGELNEIGKTTGGSAHGYYINPMIFLYSHINKLQDSV